jgi:hypothetical protein
MMAFAALMGTMFVACGDDEKEEPIVNPGDNQTQDAVPTIDQTYYPSKVELLKTWAGEYTGYDAEQEADTKIRRVLTLNANGTYRHTIYGMLSKKMDGNGEDGKFLDKFFESEGGTFEYNPGTRTLTFTVQYDSLITYKDQSYKQWTGKYYYKDRTEARYTEEAGFSKVINGQRQWITKDTYLQSKTDKALNLVFTMLEMKPGDDGNSQQPNQPK